MIDMKFIENYAGILDQDEHASLTFSTKLAGRYSLFQTLILVKTLEDTEILKGNL